MDEIIFQTLVSTPTGVGASTGKYTEEAFNENFSKVKTYLEALFGIAAITVTSEQITQIKVDTTVTPYALYYTMDPLDTPAGEVTWYDLDNVSFSDLQGSPMDNIALATILDAKASATDVSILETTVSGLDTAVTNNTTAIATNTQNIATNAANISTLQSNETHLVHTPVADGTLYLRYNTTEHRIDYSQDGSHWYSIASGSVSFADISGSPADNNNLVSYVASVVQNAISALTIDFVSSADFDLHVNNKNNPHEVTKAQIGLGDVDNTSDADKPLSTAMQAQVDALWARYPECQVLGVEDYKELFNIDVSDIPVQASITASPEALFIEDGTTETLSHHPVVVGSVTIIDDYLNLYTVNSDNQIVDDSDNVVGYFTYATGVITSTGLESVSGSVNYSYTKDTVDTGETFYVGNTLVVAGSIVITDGANTYTDDGQGHIKQGSTTVANVVYGTGLVTSTTLTTTSAATVAYSYAAPNAPDDALYFTSSTFNGTETSINPNAATYATKGYVDGLVGNINTVLSSLTTD